ncbi:MAG: TolC family protein [Chryseolinea sp.]
MKRIVIVFVIGFTMPLFLRAQTQGVPGQLTFRDAVSIGLKNNVALNQQKNQLAYTQVNKTSTMLQLGPTISAQGSAYRNDGNSFNQNRGEVVNGVIDFVNGSINANMPLFTGLGMVNSFKQAVNLNESQLYRVNRSQQDVISLVSGQFLNCLLDKQLIKINEENLESQKVRYEQIKTQVEVGGKAESDSYNQEYQVKNAELVLLRSLNTYKNDKNTLALTLQIDPSTPFEITEMDWDINTLMSDSISLSEMYATALEHRSDLKQAGYTEKAARFGYSASKGSFYPSIYAGASYGSRYNYIHGEENRTFSDQFTKDNTQLSYGFSVTIPIYNAWQYRSRTALSKVTYENAQINNTNAEVTVKTDVMRSYQNFSDARTSYEASNAQLRAAELSYQTEKERYDLGISDIVQLSIINQTYIKAQGDLQSAKFTLMFQRLLMSYALGTLRFEDIP